MPVYLMMVVVRNGQSEIVCAFVTVLETEESMRKMVQVFKSQYLAWSSSRVLISDKDCIEWAVFTKVFPGISLQLCLFHVLRSFRREITWDKMGIRAGERDHTLEILLKLGLSQTIVSTMKWESMWYSTFVITEPRSNKGAWKLCRLPGVITIQIHQDSSSVPK